MFGAADEAEVEVEEANHPNRWLSFFPPPPDACCWPDADDTIDGDSNEETVVLFAPNDDAIPWRSLAAEDVDASNSKFCDDATFALNSNSTLAVRGCFKFRMFDVCSS